MKTYFLRSVSLAALTAAAISAQAVQAFSNLDPAPTVYRSDFAYIVAPGFVTTFQFTSGATGNVNIVTLAMNLRNSTTPQAFSLNLYADNGSNAPGAVLGTLLGTSSDVVYTDTNSTLVTVAALGPDVLLTSGTKYFIGAESLGDIAWNPSFASPSLRYFNGTPFTDRAAAAFSIDVAPVPEPASMLALGLGATALLRRRRKA